MTDTAFAEGPSSVVTTAASAPDLPWMDSSVPPETRAGLLLDAMTLDQKLQQLTGAYPEIVPELPHCFGPRHVKGIAALAIPTLRVSNGPVGVGQNDCVDPALASNPNIYAAYSDPSSAKATALPSASTVAASFDPAVATMFGDVIATEMNNLALHVFEAPGLNLARLPVLGRNFEYFGEDPYLTGVMGVAEIKAIQDDGLIAMAKHFVANEQETNRNGLRDIVDERTLHQLYLLPFEMAVKDGDVASIMCAYNSVNGDLSCENDYILNTVLRHQWGFEGYVQSDFFATLTANAVKMLLSGHDLEMPIPIKWQPAVLKSALDAGQIQESDIDTALERRYVQMFKYGIFDRPIVQTPIDYDAGGEKARQIGSQGAVLLQNNGALPFDSSVQDVVVIGKATQVYAQQAVAGGAMVGRPMGAGGGSSDVVPVYTVSPVEGVRNVLADLGNTTARVRLILVDDANATATIDGVETTFTAALTEARAADSVIIMAGTIAEEGADRATFSGTNAAGTGVPDGESLVGIGDGLDWYASKRVDRPATVGDPNPVKDSHTVGMIEAVMHASPFMRRKTALVLKDNAGVAMDPALVGPSGPSMLEVWFPGQEDGHIVADLLFGVVNPSGKSPFTYPYAGRGFLDHISTAQFPGEVIDGGPIQTVQYTERLNIGYRWYDANISGNCPSFARGKNRCVAFPFGHGLSYTKFKISKAGVVPWWTSGRKPIKVNLFVKNTGARAGAEVVQVYVALPGSTGEKAKRLVGFEKVELQPGARKRVTVTIDPSASHHPMSVWRDEADEWRTPAGKFTVYVGNSSGNLHLAGTVRVLPPHGCPAPGQSADNGCG